MCVKDFVKGNLRLGRGISNWSWPTIHHGFQQTTVFPSPKADHSQRDKSLLSGVFGSFGRPGVLWRNSRDYAIIGRRVLVAKNLCGTWATLMKHTIKEIESIYYLWCRGFKKIYSVLMLPTWFPLTNVKNALAETIRFSLVFYSQDSRGNKR